MWCICTASCKSKACRLHAQLAQRGEAVQNCPCAQSSSWPELLPAGMLEAVLVGAAFGTRVKGSRVLEEAALLAHNLMSKTAFTTTSSSATDCIA